MTKESFPCRQPVSAAELRKEFDQINADKPKSTWKLLGSLLAACSFALFYGGSISDAIAAGLGAALIWGLQQYFRPVCMNEVTFQFATSFLTGCAICGLTLLCPSLHMDKIMIGDIMLLIPGLMSTNAIRDVLIGDTLSGIIRLIAALLLAAALTLGFMGAIILFGRLGL
ncbi:threonine/serine exporter family protein [Blautia sp. MSJ-19]|uniref:threonine/serine exporter family protein n=1 Tax=Blautia sp. MSJ-19 TaxID=2841517 RepID=UPI002ED17834